MGISSYSTNPASNTTINGIDIAEGCAPSGINDAIRQMMADIASGLLPLQLPTATGSANAIVVALSPAVTSYSGGQGFAFLPSASNTGATTINYGGGVINLQKRGGLALAPNDILNGVPAVVLHDGTRATLMNPQTYTHGADIASAATLNLDNATGDYVYVTGTTGITAITLAEGRQVITKFTGVLTITNGASLIAPGGANYTTAADDVITWRGEASGVVRAVSGLRASGASFGGSVPLSGLAAAAGLSAVGYASTSSAAPVAVAMTAAQLLGANAGGTALAGITLGNALSMSGTTLNASVPAILGSATYATNTSLTTTIPGDDTIPQITEGNEIMTVSATPTSASKTIVVEWVVYFSTENSGVTVGAPLFVNSTADALDAPCLGNVANGAIRVLYGRYSESAASTTARTYRVRIGTSSGAVYPNGSGAATRLYGGKLVCKMIVYEF